VLHARVAEVVERQRVRRAGTVPAAGHQRGGPGQVTEPGEPPGSRRQRRQLAQRQRLAVGAQVPQQAGEIAGRRQILCFVNSAGHVRTLTRRPDGGYRLFEGFGVISVLQFSSYIGLAIAPVETN
jgi:hypothetical protein